MSSGVSSVTGALGASSLSSGVTIIVSYSVDSSLGASSLGASSLGVSSLGVSSLGASVTGYSTVGSSTTGLPSLSTTDSSTTGSLFSQPQLSVTSIVFTMSFVFLLTISIMIGPRSGFSFSTTINSGSATVTAKSFASVVPPFGAVPVMIAWLKM